MKVKELIVQKYFDSWIKNDNSNLKNVFTDDIIYSECYGPEYHGINQILLWFNDWHKHGKVLKWDIKQFIHNENMTVAEWYFQCEYKGKVDGFNGVSLIEFTEDLKIKNLKEFESKEQHVYPYEK